MRDLPSPVSALKRKSPLPLNDTHLESQTGSPPQTPLSISDHACELPTSILPSSFRNVSSCHRCRLRKTRCDQRLPRCQSCEKVGERCVGYDPITKREIPRSYVYSLECRVNYLKKMLIDNNISFKPASAFDDMTHTEAVPVSQTGAKELSFGRDTAQEKEDSVELVKSEGKYPDINDKDTRLRSMLHTTTGAAGNAIRESLSTLRSDLDINSPEIPDRNTAERLINFYFEYASPQFPVLNRSDFMDLFNRIYSARESSSRSLYFLHIVFAIGAGIVFDDRCSAQGSPSLSTKRRKISSTHDTLPKDYHACAIKYLESSLDSSDGLGTLEELQAVVLLAHFSLLQPVSPGPAHMVELAMRTSSDLRLYCDDADLELMSDNEPLWETTAHEDGMRDLGRRLWWCVYSLDRLVSPYTGRPFSIPDQIITTELPSFLERIPVSSAGVTSERITAHYFRLRLLQSEIHQGLQFRRAQRVRKSQICGSSSFLHDFDSFSSWRKDINRRLDDWKASIPSQKECDKKQYVQTEGGQKESESGFPVVLLELDYWQTINQLYRQSLNVPPELVQNLPPGNDIRGSVEEDAEQEDLIYLKVSESSQKVLQIYRLMHHVRLVNYTYLATHSIFLAGSLFLFTIWDSPLVRGQISLNEIDYTLLAGTTVLADMMDKYSHAESCRDSLERMGMATVQMCLTTTDFGSRGKSSPALPRKSIFHRIPSSIPVRHVEEWQSSAQPPARTEKRIPQFDMNLEEIFNECIPNQTSQDSPSHSLTKQNRQFPRRRQQEYHETPFPELPPSLYNSSMQSISPVSTNASTCQEPPHPMISLDFFEFDFGDSDSLTDGGLEKGRDKKMDGSFGYMPGKRGRSNLDFGIAVDAEEFDGRENYDFLDAFLFSH